MAKSNALREVPTYLILRPLRLQLSPLLLNNHLFFAIRQCPRHAQK